MADVKDREVEVYNEPVATTARREREVVSDEGYRTALTGFPAAIKRASWGAIFAGGFVAFATESTLAMLGLAVGFSTIDPVTEANPLGGFAIGAAIWMLISTIIAFLIGGYVAGRLAGMPRRQDGVWHGIATWALVTVFSLWLMTSAMGTLVNTATGVLGRGVQFLGNAAPAAAQVLDQGNANIQLPNANQLQSQLPNVTPEEAQATADQVAATMSTAALWAFIAMIVGVICAGLGGAWGTPYDMPASTAVRRE
ncbi:MAG TPA: hypothetical protein VFG50_13290 [Rhodothermales bacterium]|nr:hypothetical protein [Rhodothermales bacterium]